MDAFDERVGQYQALGLTREAARLAAIGRDCSEAEARRALQEGYERLREQQTRRQPATLAEAESRVYEAARATLGLPVEQASVYARERREAAVREHGTVGSLAYLTQLAAGLRRCPR